ncbi:hypothetical protein LPJ81_002036 [Coemansia sp. IMI 209127]|nr:hypothetical protein LPJ81_002036 [Coemansia sp. IMI 209127]
MFGRPFASAAARCMTLCAIIAYAFVTCAHAASTYKDDRVVLGYFPVQRTVDNIPWGSLTHANVAFAFASDEGSISFEGTVVNSTLTSEQNAVNLIADGQKNGVKMLVAVGGQGNFSDYLASALSSSASQSAFVSNAISFIKKYNLDGIDIDWEYPSNISQAQNLLSTLQSMRSSLTNEFGNGNKLLTITLYNHPYLGPNVPTVDYKPYADAVDYAFTMAYDYFGSWADYTAPDAPFIDTPFYPGSFRNTTDAWLDAGWPADKLVAGLAFYGHSSVVSVDMSQNTTNQFVAIDNHGSIEGPVSGIEGTWTWRDLRDPANGALSNPTTASSGWVRTWGKYTMTPWLFRESDNLYVGYDDMDSLGIKMDYVLRKKLAGVMIWEIGYDYNNELMSYVRDFITSVDDGDTPNNCAPSDSQLDQIYQDSRDPDFYNQPSLVRRSGSDGIPDPSESICAFGKDSSGADGLYQHGVYGYIGAVAAVVVAAFVAFST